MLYIESTKNPRIKFLQELLSKKKDREEYERFVVEGVQEIDLALKGGYRLETLYFCEELSSPEEVEKFSAFTKDVVRISRQVFQKLAYRNTSGGVLGLFILLNNTLQEFKPKENCLILIAESLEKPGNIGALLRTADAAKVDAFIIADPLADFFNPNTIRSSVGTVFTNEIFTATLSEIKAWISKHNITAFAATLQNSNPYTQEDYTGSTALVVGTESTGLSEEFRAMCHKNIVIPMFGAVDSINVSVSAGILVYEAIRQRKNNFKETMVQP
ncbi:MAG: TrmH family RNA methyltransferase [Luteibaculaceae bacterium]